MQLQQLRDLFGAVLLQTTTDQEGKKDEEEENRNGNPSLLAS